MRLQRLALAVSPLLFGLGLVAACSASSGHQFSSGGLTGVGGSGAGAGAGATGSTGGPSGTGAVTASSGGLGGLGVGVGATSGTGTGGMAACQAVTHKAETLPLDMYIMQDQSGSMSDMVQGGGTKWQAVTTAFTSFVQQPGLTGISVGIQYFALETTGGMCTTTTCKTKVDCGTGCGPCFLGMCLGAVGGGNDSCTASDYAMPDVEIAPLPGVATSITTSLGKHSPSTGTPTAPALQGAVDHAKAWAMSHPGDVVIAVLATDGEPDECTPDTQAGIAQIAATALAGTPSIKTFCIGTFAPGDIPSGPNLLNAVAAAGGTNQAFNISTNSQNTQTAFLQALNQIRGTALGCTYNIPQPMPGTNADPSLVNVYYTPGGSSTPITIPQVPSKAACPATGNAWYYDNPTTPTHILLCDATCATVSADTMGSIEIALGCKTVTAQ
jgi:hypothetical protein